MSFDLLSLFLQCIINDTFKNTDKELPCQKIKIYKKLCITGSVSRIQ